MLLHQLTYFSYLGFVHNSLCDFIVFTIWFRFIMSTVRYFQYLFILIFYQYRSVLRMVVLAEYGSP